MTILFGFLEKRVGSSTLSVGKSGFRVAAGDCNVTECRPTYQTTQMDPVRRTIRYNGTLSGETEEVH